MSRREEAIKAVKLISISVPLPYAKIVAYVEELEEEADTFMVNATQSELLRQNQGKVQVLRDLLKVLNI